MYSVVMLAAMTAAPETPDFFCCKKGGCYSYAGCGYGGNRCGFGGGYGGCCLSNLCGCFFNIFCCAKGGYGHGGYGYGGYYGPPGPSIYAYNTKPNTQAEVIVRVPKNAKLIANGQETDQTGTIRVFDTPELTPGQDFKYNMAIEYTENGETRTATRQVTVRAGHRTTVDFTERATTAITVTLPENSRLTVDGQDTRMTGGQHTFRTPELTKGQPFSYTFRAEIERNGQMEVVSQEVKFKAGEPVSVDFTDATVVRTVSK